MRLTPIRSTKSSAQSSFVIDSLTSLVQSDISDRKKVDVLNAVSKEYIYSDTIQFRECLSHAMQLSKKINYTKGEVDAIHVNAFSFLRKAPDKAGELYRESKGLANKINYKIGVATATAGFGHIKMFAGEYDSAIFYYDQALQSFGDQDDENLLGLIYQQLGIAYRIKSDYTKASDYFQRSLELLNDNEKYRSFSELGIIYFLRGLHVQALDYHFEALKSQEKFQSPKALGTIYGNISNTYGNLNEPQKKKEYLEKAIAIFEKIGDKNALELSLNNMGVFYLIQGDYDSAEGYIERSLQSYEETKKLTTYIPSRYRNLGEIALRKGNYLEGLVHFQQGLELSKILEDDYESSCAHLCIGRSYNHLHRYSKAEESINVSLTLARKVNSERNLQDGYKALAVAQSAMGKYEEAYNSYVQFKVLSDSLLNAANLKKVARMELAYSFENEKRQMEADNTAAQRDLEVRALEAERIRNYVFAGLFGFIALTLAIVIILRKEKRFSASLKTINEVLNEKNQQISRLTEFKYNLSNMIAHDMKNLLGIVINRSSEHSSDMKEIHQAGQTMAQMVSNMIDIQKFEDTRMSLNKSNILLTELISEALLQVELLMTSKRITFLNEVDKKSAVLADADLMVRVFVNLLTNATKYNRVGGSITISSEQVDGRVQISLADTGLGIAEDSLPLVFDKFYQASGNRPESMPSTGLGLTFTKMVVEAHEGTIKVASNVNVGSQFSFDLPVGVPESSSDATKSGQMPKGEPLVQRLQNHYVINEKVRLGLVRFVERFQQIPHYRYGSIKSIIDTIPDSDEFVREWKKAVLFSLSEWDLKTYKSLCDLIIDPLIAN